MISAVCLLGPALLLTAGNPDSTKASDGARPRHILLLESDRRNPSPDYDFERSFVSTLREAGLAVAIRRVPLPEREAAWELVSATPTEAAPDLLLVRGDSALRLFLAMESRVFPGVPVVFTGVGADQAEEPSVPHRVTGVLMASGPVTLFRTARILQPQLRHLVLVYGDDPEDLLQAQRARAFLEHQGDHVSVTLRPLSAPDLAAMVASATTNTAVLLYLKQAEARTPDAVLFRTVNEVAAASGAPMYSGHPQLLGTGVAGVLRTDPGDEGEAGAVLAAGILANRAAGPLPEVQLLEPEWEFDWRALRKWNLNPDQLPHGSVVRFQPVPQLSFPPWSIALLLGMGLVQFGLVVRAVRLQRQEKSHVSERERLQSELTHATRVATIGQLSLSIASEINQPLTAIRTNAEAAQRLLAGQSPNMEEVQAILTDIRENDTRASDIVGRMRTLLRKSNSAPQEVQVNHVVEEAVRLVSGMATTRRVQLETELHAALPPVFGDEVQLEQVVINLLLNGLDAIDSRSLRRKQDRIRIRTHLAEGQVGISVRDTGPGLLSKRLDRLFQPIVPSHPNRLGIGLSVCRAIVEGHGGTIAGANAADGGAVFTLYLPVAIPSRLADVS